MSWSVSNAEGSLAWTAPRFLVAARHEELEREKAELEKPPEPRSSDRALRKKLAAMKSRLGDLILLAEHDAGTSRELVADRRSAQSALAKSAEWKSLKTGDDG